MSVLIVEDDAAFAELLKFWLSPRAIRFASTLAEANEMIAQEVPQCVLLDLNLPDSPPAETLAKIEALKRSSRNATVIVITGDASQVEAKGAAAVFHKDRPGFFQAVDTALVDALQPGKSGIGHAIAKEVRRLVDPNPKDGKAK